MGRDVEVPETVVRRLPIYVRALAQLEAEGVKTISSLELGRYIGVTAAQIRKDLSYFGEFGKQGRGYEVSHLLGEIKRILGLTRVWPMVVVGAGRLGQAIASYDGFKPRGFEVVAVFDNDPRKVGQRVGHLVIQDVTELPETVRALNVKIGIVAVPAAEAQKVANLMVDAGIRAVLNYAPTALHVPEGIRVEDVDPVAILQSLTYYLVNAGDSDPVRAGAAAPAGDSTPEL
jgi:redox-sensing transcriptional repressor